MKNYLLVATCLMILLGSCKSAKEIGFAQLNSTADVNNKIGSAKFYRTKDMQIKMVMQLNIKEKANSSVAVHFHEHGDCGDKGNKAHGHWNPTGENHGKWGSAAFHSGDIGNIQLNKKGNGSVIITTARWSVDEGNQNNIIGRGIIVHGGTDDYTTQPTGNSGPRIGCGVITKK